jgi:peptidoglycan LD-endopeptidase LytH
MLTPLKRKVAMIGIAIGIILLFVIVLSMAGFYFVQHYRDDEGRTEKVWRYLSDPAAASQWKMHAGTRCQNAPLTFPTDGYIGYLYGDMFQPFHRHQGIDIFGGGEPGEIAVYSASDGFLTRLPGWKSAVILRIPSDPLNPGTEIWIYYAHMAAPDGSSFIDPAFPAGTADKPVRTGDRLGYQGNYTGDPANPAGVHLHLSLVKSNGKGGWLNELDIANTLDPTPYFNLPLHYGVEGKGPTTCGL